MADVWISRKRWTCKYCDVTINDDLPSRRHHESGVRHKQNVQKALQDLYRKGEQERKDAEHTKNEMARIEALAAESYAKDQAALGAPPSTMSVASPSTSRPSAGPAASGGTKSTAGSARPRPKSTDGPETEAPQPIAQAGEWEAVQPPQPLQPTTSASSSYPTEATERDTARSFRVKEKVARLDDSDDDAAINTIKVKKRPRSDTHPEENQSRAPSWSTKEEPAGPGASVKSEQGVATSSDSTSLVKAELGTSDSTPASVKAEEGEDTKASLLATKEGDGGDAGGGGLFKKRRAGAGAGAKRVRAVP